MFQLNFARTAAVLLALSTAALLLTAGCHEDKATPAIGLTSKKADSDFLGNNACADCHQKEFRLHHGSRHDTTMHAANRESLGALAPPLGVIPLAGYTLDEQNGHLLVTRSVPTERSQTLDYVLGSGKIGMTFITILGMNALMEGHMSYFPHQQIWEVTPGQEEQLPDDDVFGRGNSPVLARRCLGCHSTTLPTTDLKIDPHFFGVGCESCHGPGRKHVEAIRVGNLKAAGMEKLDTWSGSRLNELCGTCHRNPKDVDPASIAATETHRFQPYALQRSACRTANGEPLSCLRCHDPHTDVSTDIRKYEAACLQCHATGAHPAGNKAADGPQGKVCPVNASYGCIGCHMRPKKAFAKTDIAATMVDHLISKPKPAP